MLYGAVMRNAQRLGGIAFAHYLVFEGDFDRQLGRETRSTPEMMFAQLSDEDVPSGRDRAPESWL